MKIPSGQDLIPGHFYRITEIDPNDPSPSLKAGDVVQCADLKAGCIAPGNVISDGMGCEWFADWDGSEAYRTLVVGVEHVGEVL